MRQYVSFLAQANLSLNILLLGTAKIPVYTFGQPNSFVKSKGQAQGKDFEEKDKQIVRGRWKGRRHVAMKSEDL